jgi:hypothetical protein
MPLGDRTGPLGKGPGNCRGLVLCRSYSDALTAGPLFGRGFGGGHCGCGNRFRVGGVSGWRGFRDEALPGVERILGRPTHEQEVSALKAQAERLESALGDVRKRIGELEAKAE